MKVSLKKAFSILDGRLSTEIGDVYLMLNHIFSASLFTHQLPTAMRILKDKNPDWFAKGVEIIDNLKASRETDDFQELMEIIDKEYSDVEIELGTIEQEIAFSAGLF